MICPKCGMFNPDGVSSCGNCGEQFVNQDNQFGNQPSYQKPTKFCTNCGAQIDANAAMCIKCGVMQSNAGTQPVAEDTGSVGWAFLGFFIPIVGLILFLCWNNTKPKSAKKAGMGALISVILNVVGWILYYIVFVVILATLGGGY